MNFAQTHGRTAVGFWCAVIFFGLAQADAQTTSEFGVQEGPVVALVDGAWSVGFGRVGVGGAEAIRSFSYTNAGQRTLESVTLTITGANSADFSLSQWPTLSYGLQPFATGAARSGDVLFRPKGPGMRNATLRIASSTEGVAPLDIALTGFGLAPKIAVEDSSRVQLTNGGPAYDFGTLPLDEQTVSKMFTIRNVGTTALAGISLENGDKADYYSNPYDFKTSLLTKDRLEPGESVTFQATFKPKAPGPGFASLFIASNDADENPFEISLIGTAVASNGPKMVVEWPYETKMSAGSLIDFGIVDPDGYPAVQSIGIRNIGSQTLDGLVQTITGYGWADFGASPQSLGAIRSGWSDGFGLTFDPTRPGTFSRGLRIYSNDPDQSTFDVTLKGTATSKPVKAEIVSPMNGSTLSSTSLSLRWTSGVKATAYALWCGTAPGSYEVYAKLEGTSVTDTMNVPAGKRIHVTLWSQLSGVWQPACYYFEPVAAVKAEFTGPIEALPIAQASRTRVTWSAGTGVSKRVLWVGRAYGTADAGVYVPTSNYEDVALPCAPAAPPAAPGTWDTSSSFESGPCYLTLWSLVNGVWQDSHQWFTVNDRLIGGTENNKALLTSPSNGTTLNSRTALLKWYALESTGDIALWVGSTPSGHDLYAAYEGAARSRQIEVPCDGRRVYVTLFTKLQGVWRSNAYYFTAPAVDTRAAQIISPSEGITLPDPGVTFQWNSVAGSTLYAVWVGSRQGAFDIYAGYETGTRSRTITVPNHGRRLYATVFTWIDGAWRSNRVSFNAPSVVSPKAALTSPAPGSTLPSKYTSFVWNAVPGGAAYAIWVGRTPGGYDIAANSTGTGTIAYVLTPSLGGPLYVTVWTLVGGAWAKTESIITDSVEF